MAKPLEGQRFFLVVSADADRRALIAAAVQAHIEKVHFTFATDGSDAISKIRNSQPHIVVTDEILAKQSGSRVIEWALKSAKDPIGCILLEAAPEDEKFVDDVLVGRVHFVENFGDKAVFSKVLSRALNCLASQGTQEFNVRFLSPGETLLKSGEKAEFVYILKHGQLEATATSDQKRVVLGLVEVGEFVGEMAYINGEARSADVNAVGSCELIEIPIDMMDHLLFLKPAWSKALMKTLTRRLKQSNEALTRN